MKLKQKLTFSLFAIVAMTTGILGAGHNKALAAGTIPVTSEAEITNAKYTFQNKSTITATLGSVSVTFFDSKISDTTYNYQPQGGLSFCNGNGSITVNAAAYASGAPATASAKINAAYMPSGLPASCTSPADFQINIGNTAAANSLLTWDGDNLLTYTGITLVPSPKKPNAYIPEGESDFICMTAIAVVKGAGATLYEHGNAFDYPHASNFPDLDGIDDPGCGISKVNGQSGDTGKLKDLAAQTTPISGTKGKPAGGSVGGVEDNTPTCESNSHIGLEWVVCPILKGVDGVVNNFYGFVLDQLCFNTGGSTTAGGVTCGGNTILTDPVEKAWSTFRVIATALIVIIMLIMVISQALGGAMFDAYTIRKVLPKLVIAVIVMQISYFLAKFLIDLSNDTGKGVSDLMFSPFPDSYRSIDHALGNIDSSGVMTATTVFAGAAALAVMSGLTVVGFLLLGLTGLAAVFVGFLVLFFRKMLILLCVILIPIALVAFILPGTERMWKLWRETFTKLLVMFPMIAALIAAGQIFGSLAGASSTGPIALFTVVLGFFGPLFILPKTYQWGGSALGAIGGAVMNGTKGIRGKPKEYALNQGKINKEQRAQNRAFRLATTHPENRRMIDRVMAGEFNFARNRGARERQFEKTLSEGEKASRENVAAQMLRVGYQRMQHGPARDAAGNPIPEGHAGYVPNKLDALQAWLEGREYGGIAPDEATMGYAFDELARLGDPDRIRSARRNSRGHEAVWTEALARNFGRMNEIARDFTLAPDLSRLSPRQFTTQDADTAQELLRQVTGYDYVDQNGQTQHVNGGYVMDRETGQSRQLSATEAAEQRQSAIALAEEIADTPLIYSDLGPDHRAVVEQLRSLRDPTEVSVRQAREQGRPPIVVLPEGQVLAANAQAQANLTQALTVSNPQNPQEVNRRRAVAAQFAAQLDDPNHGPAYENFLQTRVQAQAGSSQEAADMNAELARAYRTHVDQQVRDHEQELLAQGAQPATVQAAVQAAQQQADQRYQARFP